MNGGRRRCDRWGDGGNGGVDLLGDEEGQAVTVEVPIEGGVGAPEQTTRGEVPAEGLAGEGPEDGLAYDRGGIKRESVVGGLEVLGAEGFGVDFGDGREGLEDGVAGEVAVLCVVPVAWGGAVFAWGLRVDGVADFDLDVGAGKLDRPARTDGKNHGAGQRTVRGMQATGSAHPKEHVGCELASGTAGDGLVGGGWAGGVDENVRASKEPVEAAFVQAVGVVVIAGGTDG